MRLAVVVGGLAVTVLTVAMLVTVRVDHAIAASACHRGTVTASGGCECDPGWSGEQCNAVNANIHSCADWKKLLAMENAVDGEYIIRVRQGDAYVVWCHGMAGDSPKEFISLPAGPDNNYALKYERQIPARSYVPCTFDLIAWSEGGRTSFSKIRFLPDSLQIVANDYTFAERTSRVPSPFGTANDCVGNGVKQCPAKGRAHIDLTSTPFRIATTVSASFWHTTGDVRAAAPDVTISTDRRSIDITCGGGKECSGCAPSQEIPLEFALEGSPCDDASSSSTSICDNDGVCVPGEGGHVCLCTGEWTGNYCTQPCDTSSDASCAAQESSSGNGTETCACQNGGTCGEDTGVCYCPDGWTGTECQEFDYCEVIAQRYSGEACLEEGECRNVVYDVIETPSGPCVFPFLYQGRLWETCVEEEDSPPWCALTKNFDADGERDECLVHASKPFRKPDPSSTPPPPPPPPSSDATATHCADIGEGQELTLTCVSDDGDGSEDDVVISSITFASYGTPEGSCDNGFIESSDCHAHGSLDRIEDACLGKLSCTVSANNALFGDPCEGKEKTLAVSYTCGNEVSGEWVTADDKLFLSSAFKQTVTTDKGCGAAAPALSVRADTGITLSSFSACDSDYSFGRVAFKAPFHFTRVKVSFAADGAIFDETSCAATENNEGCADRVLSGGSNPPAGIFLSAGKDLIKVGGEWADGANDGEDAHVTFTIPSRTLVESADALVFTFAASSPAASYTLHSFHVHLFQPARELLDGVIVEYDFNTPVHSADGVIQPSPAGATGPQLTCSVCPTWVQDGVNGGSLAFSGHAPEFITMGMQSLFGISVNSDFSIAMWVKPDYKNCNHDGVCDDQPLICSDSGRINRFCVYLDGASKKPTIRAGSILSSGTVVRGDISFGEGVWTHLVVSYAASNGRRASIWVNGFEADVGAIPITAADITLWLGKGLDSTYFRGEIDSLAFYDHALSTIEVSELSGRVPPSLPSTLFDFNRGLIASEYGLAVVDCSTYHCPTVEADGGIDGGAAAFPLGPPSCIAVPNAASTGVSFASTSTVMAWINPSLTTRRMTLLSFAGQESSDIRLVLENARVTLKLQGRPIVNTQLVLPHVWTHVAVRISQTEGSLDVFVNGTAERFDFHPPFSVDEDGKFGIGCALDRVNTQTYDAFAGSMDNVALFNHFVSNEDILRYAAEVVPESLAAEEANCDFDASFCVWNSEQSSNSNTGAPGEGEAPTFARWQGPALGPALGPLMDVTLSSLHTVRKQCAANGHTYAFVDLQTAVRYSDALLLAGYFGGHLATIADISEQRCVEATTSRPAYLGASFNAKTNRWAWVQPAESWGGYTNFASQSEVTTPNNPNLVLNTLAAPRGSWGTCDDSCNFVRGFILEYETVVGPVYQNPDAEGRLVTSQWSARGSDGAPTPVQTMARCGDFPPSLGLSGAGTLTLTLPAVGSGGFVEVDLFLLIESNAGDSEWAANDTITITANGNGEVSSWQPALQQAPILAESDGCVIGGEQWTKQEARDVSFLLDRRHAAAHAEEGLVISVTSAHSFAVSDVRVAAEQYGPSQVCSEERDRHGEPCYLYANVTSSFPSSTLASPLLAPPKEPDTCRVRFSFDMAAEEWTSAQSCTELDWRLLVEDGVREGVCGSRAVGGQCYGVADYEEAAAVCLAAGARLCRLDEIQAHILEHTGCTDQDALIWSSTPCGEEKAYAARSGGGEDVVYCEDVNELAAAVGCCADSEERSSASRLNVFFESYGSSKIAVWSTAGGPNGWVEAVVPLPFTPATQHLPFTVSFETSLSSVTPTASVIGIDQISFEGCEPNLAPVVEETEDFYLIQDGHVVQALVNGEWEENPNEAPPTVVATSAAPTTPSGITQSLLYAAKEDNEDKVAAHAASDAYVELGGDAFTFEASVVFSSLPLNADNNRIVVGLTGGMLDGSVKVDYADKTILFSGELFGASALSVDMASMPAAATVSLKRDGSSLAMLLNGKLVHSFHIGEVSLHHVSLLATTNIAFTHVTLHVVVASGQDPDGNGEGGDGGSGDGDRKTLELPITAAFNDLVEHPDGSVTPNDYRLPLAYSNKTVATSDTRTIIGLRYDDVGITRDDVITGAYVQFTAATDSGTGHSTLTINAEYSRSSDGFAHITQGAPRKTENGDDGGEPFFLASTFSSVAACAFIGGVYQQGNRRDTGLRVTSYWAEDGTLHTRAGGQYISVITYLECKLSSGVADGALLERVRTKHVVSWSPAPWAAQETEAAEKTPDLAAVLNEVIHHPLWEAGNAITLFVAGHSEAISARTAFSFEGAVQGHQPLATATLHITFAPRETAPEADLEAICQFPFTYNRKRYYACTTDPNPLNPNALESRPWCGTARVASEADFGFCSSHVIETYGGNANTATFTATCAFPFIYEGKTYTDCVTFTKPGRNGLPWCATTSNYDDDGLWGYCTVPTYGGSGGGDPCVFPFYFSGKRYTECTTDGGRGDDRPWCFVEGTTGSESADTAKKWGFCSDGSESVESWGYTCDCPAGFFGHRCGDVCPEDKYGKNCVGDCKCQNGADCNPVTGECNCLPGWGGPDCSVEDGSLFSCTSCINQDPDTVCEDSDGHCTCAPGWSLPHCEEECPLGSFGRNCSQVCQCKNDGACSPLDGSCDCPPGYSPETNCEHPCDEGYFGEGCLQECLCLNGGLCDPFDGHCTCPPYYRGLHCQVPPPPMPVFVNELHYNSAGDDLHEAVEIAGPAGVDLSGYQLITYSGDSGSGKMKQVVAFSATGAGSNIIPDMDNGFGVLYMHLEQDTLENGGGAGDGFALINANGAVVQFLSWQGSFVAVDGPARGLMSENIHVWEPPHTPGTSSLQLVGRGHLYDDFGWVPPRLSSFGTVNAQQTFFSDDSEGDQQLDFVAIAGVGTPDAVIASALAASGSTDRVAGQLNDALAALLGSGSSLANVRLVQAAGGNGLAVYFSVVGKTVPVSEAVASRVLAMRSIQLGFRHFIVTDVLLEWRCVPGTIFEDSTEQCITDTAASTTSPSTTTVTTTTISTTSRQSTATHDSSSHSSSSSSSSSSSRSSSRSQPTTGSATTSPSDGGSKSSGKKKLTTTYMMVAVVGVVIVLSALVYLVNRRTRGRTMRYDIVNTNDAFEGFDSDEDEAGVGETRRGGALRLHGSDDESSDDGGMGSHHQHHKRSPRSGRVPDPAQSSSNNSNVAKDAATPHSTAATTAGTLETGSTLPQPATHSGSPRQTGNILLANANTQRVSNRPDFDDDDDDDLLAM